jgi:hypothetical protein
MLRVSVAVTLALTLTAALSAQDQPKGPPPTIMTAQPGKNGVPTIVVPVLEYQPKKVVKEVNVNGRIDKLEEVVYVPVTKHVIIPLDAPGNRVYDVAGKQLDAKALKLTKATPVLVSSNGQPVDPFYTRLAREGTLVVVMSMPGQNTGAVPPPPPPRKSKRPS